MSDWALRIDGQFNVDIGNGSELIKKNELLVPSPSPSYHAGPELQKMTTGFHPTNDVTMTSQYKVSTPLTCSVAVPIPLLNFRASTPGQRSGSPGAARRALQLASDCKESSLCTTKTLKRSALKGVVTGADCTILYKVYHLRGQPAFASTMQRWVSREHLWGWRWWSGARAERLDTDGRWRIQATFYSTLWEWVHYLTGNG